MSELFHAGVYWPVRRESVGESARRAETFFRLLSQCDSVYAEWFEQADSLEEGRQLRFEPSRETLLRFFESRRYRQGPFGFSFNAWTGHAEEGEGGVVMLGSGSAEVLPANACLLDLPHGGEEARRVLTVPVLTQVMRALVLAWEPDWGGVMGEDDGDLGAEAEGPSDLGWLLYFSHGRGAVPPLPEPVRVEPVEDLGSLVILTPERFSVRNPAHVALAREVNAVLVGAGLLER
jgi:hypothetical protein